MNNETTTTSRIVADHLRPIIERLDGKYEVYNNIVRIIGENFKTFQQKPNSTKKQKKLVSSYQAATEMNIFSFHLHYLPNRYVSSIKGTQSEHQHHLNFTTAPACLFVKNKRKHNNFGSYLL
ncbi:BAR domain-containing protein [Aristophania vespae]|uniref:hypothetical protein n=1 Tax=Aristophania vespae TaxID=2697033 RepID=UPI00235188C5|nr:hypothetical protein [Aristophania vespae]UMM63168.1 hypothetical protein DM15PD_01230 [Aristophania vespae]